MSSDWQRRRRSVYERDGGRCAFCATTLARCEPWTLDHVLPIAAGGPSCLANLVLACVPCNNEKGGRLLLASWRSFDLTAWLDGTTAAVRAAYWQAMQVRGHVYDEAYLQAAPWATVADVRAHIAQREAHVFGTLADLTPALRLAHARAMGRAA